MNLAQAVEASQERGAYRVVGTLRILVQFGKQKLRVLVQCRNGRRWMLTDSGGGVRYLNSVLRDIDGSWVVEGCDVAALDIVAHCLPAAYQHLLAPDSDDWRTMIGKKTWGNFDLCIGNGHSGTFLSTRVVETTMSHMPTLDRRTT